MARSRIVVPWAVSLRAPGEVAGLAGSADGECRRSEGGGAADAGAMSRSTTPSRSTDCNSICLIMSRFPPKTSESISIHARSRLAPLVADLDRLRLQPAVGVGGPVVVPFVSLTGAAAGVPKTASSPPSPSGSAQDSSLPGRGAANGLDSR